MHVYGVLVESGTETRSSMSNAGAKGYICQLVYLRQLLANSHLGKQYCVVKSAPLRRA